jgi:cytochrome c oxidase cbb3-type subunit I/II
MLYWLAPRLFQAPLWSKKLMATHFWIATIGILLYILSIYTAGLTQGLMWRAFDKGGELQYPFFVETVTQLIPMYWIRVVGGVLYLTGMILCAVNIVQTWRARPATYDVPVVEAPALSRDYVDPVPPQSRLEANIEFGHKGDVWMQGWWHRRWERMPFRFVMYTILAVGTASLLELVPTFLIKSNVPTIASVQPYTPLELGGRDIYISEGCYNCHSQMIRPLWAEVKRYGEYSKPGEFVYDHPFQWGSRRIGPDLAREGGRQSHDWHVRHMENPQQMVAQSIMPGFSHLLVDDTDFAGLQARVRVMAMLGVPYGTMVNDGEAEKAARAQAASIASDLEKQGGYAGLKDKKILALVAYLQRLGTDISKPAPADPSAPASAAPVTPPPAEPAKPAPAP